MEVKTCPNCGEYNSAIAWICKICKQDLNNIVITILCTKCGTENSIDELNCKNCQSKLENSTKDKATYAQSESKKDPVTMSWRLFLAGLFLGGFGWLLIVSQFYIEMLFFWVVPVLMAGTGGALGFVIGDFIDDIRKQKRTVKIKKKWFGASFIVGWLIYFLYFSSLRKIYIGEAVFVGFGFGLFLGLIGYIIGTVIDHWKHSKGEN